MSPVLRLVRWVASKLPPPRVIYDRNGRTPWIVLCWGSHNRAIARLLELPVVGVLSLARASRAELLTFGRAQDGAPRHASRIAYATRAVPA